MIWHRYALSHHVQAVIGQLGFSGDAFWLQLSVYQCGDRLRVALPSSS
ncbi:hypothetical protein H6F43_03270 [Leptolyngbya sp. FACHB-36]|nr:hypothetical protein [Leptolyngbya sp. FACHB-36]MBD2019204.1 hypothetical protein [Leptolyngbya sp. FACHB-36]